MEYLQISILLPTLSSTSTYRDVLLGMIDFLGCCWSRLCNETDKAIIDYPTNQIELHDWLIE